MLEEANAALRENAQHYIDHPRDVHDRDSFHWHGEQVMRLIDMYGPKGTAHAGCLTAETEALCLKPVWEYLKARDTLAEHYQATPTINGRPIDYAPDKVFDSPFLISEYNSGVVTISKGERRKVLNFNANS